MFLRIIFISVILCGIVLPQTNSIQLSITNLRNDSTVNNSNNLIFDITLLNGTADTIEYSGGQIYLQMHKYWVSGVAPNFIFRATSLPDTLKYANAFVRESGDSLQLCCTARRPVGRGKGFKIAPEDKVLLGTFVLIPKDSSGFPNGTPIINWRTYQNAASPYSMITLTRNNKLVDVSRECLYQVKY